MSDKCHFTKEISIRKAVIVYKIPYSTLQDRIQKSNIEGLKQGRKSVFSLIIENDITKHIKYLAKLFYGITPLQLRNAELGEKNKIKHNFNNDLNLVRVD